MLCRVIEATIYPEGGTTMTDVRQRTEGEGKEPEHTHPATEHSHDYRREDEERDHAKEAHIHDHTAPTESPA
jgi:hypothetical protein